MMKMTSLTLHASDPIIPTLRAARELTDWEYDVVPDATPSMGGESDAW